MVRLSLIAQALLIAPQALRLLEAPEELQEAPRHQHPRAPTKAPVEVRTTALQVVPMIRVVAAVQCRVVVARMVVAHLRPVVVAEAVVRREVAGVANEVMFSKRTNIDI